jgi:tetratricopeptide (TPR) repeat protein
MDDSAVDDFEDVSRTNDFYIYLHHGMYLLSEDDYDGARRLFMQALEADPMFTEARFRLGEVNCRAVTFADIQILVDHYLEYEEAINHFEMVLRQLPNHGPTHLRLGILFLEHANSPAKAKAHLLAARRRGTPHDALIADCLGKISRSVTVSAHLSFRRMLREARDGDDDDADAKRMRP